jgi:hypothetical protein
MAMQCDQIAELLADYWAGALDPVSRNVVDDHLAECGSCQQAAALWTRLGSLPDALPGPELRARFDTMLAAYQQGLDQSRQRHGGAAIRFGRWAAALWPKQPAFQFAIALVCLVGGGIGGHLLTASHDAQKELARVQNELTETREMMAVSLLQQQSAGERLRGVSWSCDLAAPDKQVLSALINTLKSDPSVDVRLAAADGLRKYAHLPLVRQGLVDALNAHQSPLVQIELIDELTDLHERRSIDSLRRLESDSSVNATVRQRAGWAIQQF